MLKIIYAADNVSTMDIMRCLLIVQKVEYKRIKNHTCNYFTAQ